jgi:hypothetical protein
MVIAEAMMALKRKALYMTQIEKLNGARLKLDEQIIAIESASTNLIVLDAMSEGAQTMKQINRQMYVFFSFQAKVLLTQVPLKDLWTQCKAFYNRPRLALFSKRSVDLATTSCPQY